MRERNADPEFQARRREGIRRAAERRRAEKAMAEDPMMAEYMSHMAGEMQFLDITDPDID